MLIHKKPIVPPEENPYYHKINNGDLQNVETLVTAKYKTKGVTPPPSIAHEELLHIINQQPQLAAIPPGSVLEVHNVPINHNPPNYLHPLDQLLQEIQQATYHRDNNKNVTTYYSTEGSY